MRIFWVVFAAFFALVSVAEESPKENAATEGTDGLKGFQWRGDDGKPTVAPTGKLLRVDDPEVLSGTPRGSLAALVSRGSNAYEWIPSDNPAYSTGGAMLSDVMPAPDESAMLMLERVGKGDGPFGSRLVLFNLFNGKIPHVWVFPDRWLVRFAVLPGARRIFAVQRGQELLKQGWRIVAFAPRKDVIDEESVELPDGVADWCFDEENIYVKSQDEAVLRIFEREALANPPRVVKMRAPGGFLVRLEEGMICNVTPGMAEYRRIEEGLPVPVRTVTLPEGFVANFAAAGEGEDVIVGENGGDVLYIHGNSARKLSSGGGNGAVWNGTERYLILHEQKKNVLSKFRLPRNLRSESSIQVAEARPRTLGEVQWLFAGSGNEQTIWVVDRRCNIYRMTAKGKRWEKTLLRRAE